MSTQTPAVAARQSSEYLAGRTVRIERSAFASRDVPCGPAHVVPKGGYTALCGEVVDDLHSPWSSAGLGAAPACPLCSALAERRRTYNAR